MVRTRPVIAQTVTYVCVNYPETVVNFHDYCFVTVIHIINFRISLDIFFEDVMNLNGFT